VFRNLIEGKKERIHETNPNAYRHCFDFDRANSRLEFEHSVSSLIAIVAPFN